MEGAVKVMKASVSFENENAEEEEDTSSMECML